MPFKSQGTDEPCADSMNQPEDGIARSGDKETTRHQSLQNVAVPKKLSQK